MTRPGGWWRHVAVGVASVLMAWLGVAAVAEVAPLPDAPVAAHTYSASEPATAFTHVTTERGPPFAYDHVPTFTSVDASSHRTSLRSVSPPTYDHNAWPRFASIATSGATTQDLAVGLESSVGRVRIGVAANGAASPVGRKVVTKEFEDGVTTKYGWEMPVAPGANAPGVIGGRAYSGHALDQMQSRGFVPSVVEDTIRSGVSAPSRGATVYYGSANNVSVVVNSNGRVITASYGDLRP